MNAKRTTPKYYYSVTEYQRGDYHHLQLRIWDYREPEHGYIPDGLTEKIDITYQGNHNEPGRWYAGCPSISNDYSLESWRETIRKLSALCPSGNLDNVQEILDHLEKVGQYVIQDPRINQYVTALYPADYLAYQDDRDAAGNQYFYVTVLAKEEETARHLINRKMIESLDHHSDEQYYINWVNAGKPVKRYSPYFTSEPDFRTIDERINSVSQHVTEYQLA